MVTPLN